MTVSCTSLAGDLEPMAMPFTSPAGGVEPMAMSHASLHQGPALGRLKGQWWELERLCQPDEGDEGCALEPGSRAQDEEPELPWEKPQPSSVTVRIQALRTTTEFISRKLAISFSRRTSILRIPLPFCFHAAGSNPQVFRAQYHADSVQLALPVDH